MNKFLLPSKLFVTGTDTDVGKTVVSAILMCGTRGKYWKPVQSGLGSMTDTEWIRQVSGLPDSHFVPERYRLSRPLSPHAAAAIDGVSIGLDDFQAPDTPPFDPLIVEGAGGVMVPLNERHFMLDLIVRLGLPVMVVASSRLGTINHTLLTLDKLRSRNAAIAGVVLNGPLDCGNRQAVEQFGHVPVVAQIESLPSLSRSVLEKVFAQNFVSR
ncbi:MAG: dethiobiotin synthase [Desulfobacteraceae bacterium]|nr:MAG: dethiobiotin synthase [Desulfobacteraceae bacterium]